MKTTIRAIIFILAAMMIVPLTAYAKQQYVIFAVKANDVPNTNDPTKTHKVYQIGDRAPILVRSLDPAHRLGTAGGWRIVRLLVRGHLRVWAKQPGFVGSSYRGILVRALAGATVPGTTLTYKQVARKILRVKWWSPAATQGDPPVVTFGTLAEWEAAGSPVAMRVLRMPYYMGVANSTN